MLPHQQVSWVIPTCMIWAIGFFIACTNLTAHFKGERHGQRVYKWPPRPFREVTFLKPLWPFIYFLPAVIWPVWLLIFIVRQNIAKEVVDEEMELESATRRPVRGFQCGGWEEQEGQGRQGFEIERGSYYMRPESYIPT